MSWQPAIDLTDTFGAPVMFGNPQPYVFFDVPTIVYEGFTQGVGGNGHIFQLQWLNNEWLHKDLTSEASAPLVFSDVRAYSYLGASQHVVYLGRDQGLDYQVHELYAYIDTKWHHNNLTKAVSGGAPLALTDPTGYEFRNIQHVVYQGTNSHIYELWQDSTGWHVNDLTNAGVVGQGPLTARVFPPIDTQHITFCAIGGLGPYQIHELWWNANGWQHSDLTNASQAPLAAGDLTNYSFSEQGTQHINYLGTDGHVHELWWNYENGWQHSDLTSATGAPLGGLPRGYVFKNQGTQHVVYRGNEGHIHELWRNSSGWHHSDLSIAAPGAPFASGNPTGFETTPTTARSVIYAAGDDHHVIELKWVP